MFRPRLLVSSRHLTISSRRSHISRRYSLASPITSSRRRLPRHRNITSRSHSRRRLLITLHRSSIRGRRNIISHRLPAPV